ncbi:MAG: hypothetical protein ACOC1Z_04715 [Cyanobacteriota bacterium]
MQVSKYTLKGTRSSSESQIFVAIEGLLQQQIKISLRGGDNNDFEPPHCWLKLQKNQINYRSAIALAFGGKYSYPPSTLAQQLSTSLKQQLNVNFVQVKVTPPAWLDFRITETAIQQWLQENLNAIAPQPFPRSISSQNSFSEYIRGRCSSILNLGISESIISETPHDWKIPSFPHQNWLTAADWQFLSQLMATIDDLECPSGKRKRGLSLPQSFDQFYRHCQIFNRQQPHFPEISQLRLYLIALTEAILRCMGKGLF